MKFSPLEAVAYSCRTVDGRMVGSTLQVGLEAVPLVGSVILYCTSSRHASGVVTLSQTPAEPTDDGDRQLIDRDPAALSRYELGRV